MKNQPFHKRMKFAAQGFSAAFRLESSFRLQCVAAIIVFFILIWRNPPIIWWVLLMLNCGLILATELFNTALEHLTDHLHPEIHPSIKIVKDCAAAAVFTLSITALGIFVAFIYETFLF